MAADVTTYSKRESVLEGTHRTWRAEPDALVQVLPTGECRLPWGTVRQVRLRYAPTRLKSWRRIFTIDGLNGISMSFDNGHYRSFGEFEDRSEAFSSFIAIVLDRVTEHAPAARFFLGATPTSYAALLLVMMIPMGLLCWIVLTLPVPDVRPDLGIIARLLLICAMLPIAGLWAAKARPRQATPQELRDSLP